MTLRLSWIKNIKAFAISLFAILLLSGSACTKVYVSIHQPASSGLTGTHCKLQRDLRNQEQQTDFWCWAASAHTVIEYIRQQSIQQCDIATVALSVYLDAELTMDPLLGPDDPIPDCCMATAKLQKPKDSTPTSTQKARDACWRAGLPEMVFDTAEFRMNYELYEYDLTNIGPQGLGWDEIVAEICADRPMISTVAYSSDVGGGGHAVVIGGYSEMNDGTQWVHVYDPGYSTLEGDYYLLPYEIYLGDPGIFTHARDYKNISMP